MEFCKTVLRTGTRVPAIGFGTGVVKRYTRNRYLYYKRRFRQLLGTIRHLRLHPEWHADIHMKDFVDEAVDDGYRLFDSGRMYGYSEVAIGEGVRSSGIKREDLFLVTKVSDLDIERKYSPSDVSGNLSNSLRYLQTGYVDAYLLHWPHGDWPAIYRQMEREYHNGRVRAIGVCNFRVSDFERLNEFVSVPPMICQTEIHPFYTRKDIRTYCKAHDILIMAHTPTARMCPKVRENPTLQMLANKYGKSIAQIILRWHIQNGIVPIVSSRSQKHRQENLQIFDFQLTAEEMKCIEALNEDYVMLPGNGIDDPNYQYNL